MASLRCRSSNSSAKGCRVGRVLRVPFASVALLLVVVAAENSTGAGPPAGTTLEPPPPPAEESSAASAAAAAEKATLLSEKAALTSEKDALISEKAALISERDALISEKTALAAEKEGLISEKDALTSEKAALASEKAELEKKEAQLREQLSEVTTAREELQNNLAAKEIELQAAVTNGAGQVSKIASEMATASREAEASMKEHEEREQANTKELNTQLESVRQQLSDTSEEHQVDESRAQRLESEVQQLNMSLNVTKTYLNIYKEMVTDPALQLYVRAKATQIYHHPGVEGAANKTYTHVLPTLQAGHLRGEQWLNDTYNYTYATLLEQMARSGLDEYVGKERVRTWVPALSGFLVYGVVLVPLLITIWCLTSVQRFVCRVRPCLLFCHLYFAVVTACAAVFAASTGTDPLRTFATHETSSFLFVQTCFGLLLLCYFAMVFAVVCAAFMSSAFCKRVVQLLFAMLVCTAYFVLVWTPAMTDRQPWLEEAVTDALAAGLGPDQVPRSSPIKTCAPYALLCFIFLVMLCIERCVQKTNGVEPKKGDARADLSFRMTDALPGDEVLASIIGTGEAEGKHE